MLLCWYRRFEGKNGRADDGLVDPPKLRERRIRMNVPRKYSCVGLSLHLSRRPPYSNSGGSMSGSSIIIPGGTEGPIHLNKVKSRYTVVRFCSARCFFFSSLYRDTSIPFPPEGTVRGFKAYTHLSPICLYRLISKAPRCIINSTSP